MQRKARLQQSFATIDDRKVTILLPKAQSSGEAGVSNSATSDKDEGDADQLELEMVMRLWRERHAKDGEERFESAAAKKLRLLRASKTYPYVLLRVRLPEGVYLQARFNLDESLKVGDNAWPSLLVCLKNVHIASMIACVDSIGRS